MVGHSYMLAYFISSHYRRNDIILADKVHKQ